MTPCCKRTAFTLVELLLVAALALWPSIAQAQMSAKDYRTIVRAQQEQQKARVGVVEIKVTPLWKTKELKPPKKVSEKQTHPEQPMVKKWKEAKNDLDLAQRGLIVAGKPRKLMRPDGKAPYYRFPSSTQKSRAIATKKASLAKIEKKASKYLPKKGPSLNFLPAIGKIGSLDFIVTVVQVLDEGNALARTGFDGKLKVFLLHNISTTGWTDGKRMWLRGQLKVTDTYQYQSTAGMRTIFVLEPFED